MTEEDVDNEETGQGPSQLNIENPIRNGQEIQRRRLEKKSG